MSTRSAIGYMTPTGNVRAVYCHFDGHIDGIGSVGETLHENYAAAYKVAQLVENGDISSLGTEIAKSVYYGRDRKEDDTNTKAFVSVDEFMDEFGDDFEYIYLYTRAGWTVSDNGKTFVNLASLKIVHA